MIKYLDKLRLFDGCKYVSNDEVFDYLADALFNAVPNDLNMIEIMVINPDANNHIIDYNGTIKDSKDILCSRAQVRYLVFNKDKSILLGEYFTLFHNDFRMYDSISFNFHYDYGFMYSNKEFKYSSIDFPIQLSSVEIADMNNRGFKVKSDLLDYITSASDDIYCVYFGYDSEDNDFIVYEELME